MKNLWTCIILLMMVQPAYQHEKKTVNKISVPTVRNLFIITMDGFRWQEIFNGADSLLINDEKYTPDAATIKLQFWASSPEERRKKLMPFFWNVIATKGEIFGNRQYDNKVNVENAYSISYPGYNEIFTGNTDFAVSSNAKNPNPNVNILEYLNNKESFKNRVVAFTSWDVFPYILNKKRSHLPMNAGYENITDINLTLHQQYINEVQNDAVNEKSATRFDELTFLTAKEYIRKHQPRVVFLGLGETDEFAHKGRYDLYLQQASKIDGMIEELWHYVQTTPGYKDNTTFIITTDHGRGSKTSKWTDHGTFIKGSSQTWLAIMGPGIEPLGEVKDKEQLYQAQIAQTIANLVGQKFISDESVAPAISFR